MRAPLGAATATSASGTGRPCASTTRRRWRTLTSRPSCADSAWRCRNCRKPPKSALSSTTPAVTGVVDCGGGTGMGRRGRVAALSRARLPLTVTASSAAGGGGGAAGAGAMSINASRRVCLPEAGCCLGCGLGTSRMRGVSLHTVATGARKFGVVWRTRLGLDVCVVCVCAVVSGSGHNGSPASAGQPASKVNAKAIERTGKRGGAMRACFICVLRSMLGGPPWAACARKNAWPERMGLRDVPPATVSPENFVRR